MDSLCNNNEKCQNEMETDANSLYCVKQLENSKKYQTDYSQISSNPTATNANKMLQKKLMKNQISKNDYYIQELFVNNKDNEKNNNYKRTVKTNNYDYDLPNINQNLNNNQNEIKNSQKRATTPIFCNYQNNRANAKNIENNNRSGDNNYLLEDQFNQTFELKPVKFTKNISKNKYQNYGDYSGNKSFDFTNNKNTMIPKIKSKYNSRNKYATNKIPNSKEQFLTQSTNTTPSHLNNKSIGSKKKLNLNKKNVIKSIKKPLKIKCISKNHFSNILIKNKIPVDCNIRNYSKNKIEINEEEILGRKLHLKVRNDNKKYADKIVLNNKSGNYFQENDNNPYVLDDGEEINENEINIINNKDNNSFIDNSLQVLTAQAKELHFINQKINNKLNREMVIEKKAVEEMQEINTEYENKVKELVNVINSLKQANENKKNKENKENIDSKDNKDNKNSKNSYVNNEIKNNENIIENTISININDKKDSKNSKINEINEKQKRRQEILAKLSPTKVSNIELEKKIKKPKKKKVKFTFCETIFLRAEKLEVIQKKIIPKKDINYKEVKSDKFELKNKEPKLKFININSDSNVVDKNVKLDKKEYQFAASQIANHLIIESLLSLNEEKSE